MKTRLKLFWRPADLKETDALQAYEKNHFPPPGEQAHCEKNPTPFYVSLASWPWAGKVSL